uniref:Putative secreted protein n=1 Tax=Amblyomma cajennense TaxID=34607 RepID=A0A023FBI9_AMBCJ
MTFTLAQASLVLVGDIVNAVKKLVQTPSQFASQGPFNGSLFDARSVLSAIASLKTCIVKLSWRRWSTSF